MRIDNRKIVKKILSKIKATDYQVNDLIETLMEDDDSKVPVKKMHHVGIEVECFGPYRPVYLQKLIYMYDLEDYIQITEDGSIDAAPITYGATVHPYELRILLKEAKLKPMLKKIGKFFKAARLETNDSCGLHVHLDMRNRSFDKCYAKLVKFQDVLFGMVDKGRWDNEFCEYSDETPDFHERYKAINAVAFQSKKTIEVRLHHGTVDTERIYQWVKLLLSAINAKKAIPTFTTKAEIVAWPGLKGALKGFVKRHYKSKWLKEREDYIDQTPRRNDEHDDDEVW